jgi:hypothetical protein
MTLPCSAHKPVWDRYERTDPRPSRRYQRQEKHRSLERENSAKLLAERRRQKLTSVAKRYSLAAIERQGLEAEIERAKRILDLEDNWDGEGSPGYSEDTFHRAIAFLTTHAKWLWESCRVRLPVPRIGPGPDGTIDLHWKQPSWELLVNIPADANEPATFYGDNYGAQKIRGSLDPRNFFNLGIAAWLMN